MVTIQQYKGTHNISKRYSTVKWIAIHYTAGWTSRSGTAKNTCAWFANAKATGSADFVVDDETIWQYNPDPAGQYCWSVGGDPAQYKALNSLAKGMYNKCTNQNSISIEICSNDPTKKMDWEASPWYFTDAELQLAAELVNYLMAKYSVTIDHVVMHNQVTGKPCPAMWTRSEEELQGWYSFKKLITGETAASSATTTATTAATTAAATTTTTTGGFDLSTLGTIKSGSKGTTVKRLQQLLNANGFSCGTADGIAGTKTAAAIKSFQTANGLTADGICGAKTWAKMLVG